MENSNPKPDRPAKLRTQRINVTLDSDTIATAKQLGNGNLSRGLRIAVKQSQELERVLKQLSEYQPGRALIKDKTATQRKTHKTK